jgi:hypothetical protein
MFKIALAVHCAGFTGLTVGLISNSANGGFATLAATFFFLAFLDVAINEALYKKK